MNFQNIFFNDAGRWRSGWRAFFFSVAYFILTVVLGLGALLIMTSLPLGFTPNSLLSLVTTFSIFSFVAVVVGWFCAKFFEDLPFRSLGAYFTKNWLKDIFLGFVVGTGAMILAAVISSAGGGLRFEYNQSAGGSAMFLTLGATLLIFIVGAISEETLFRGYILQTLFRSRHVWVGIIITSLFFASAHNNNPSANPLSWLNTFIAGVLFAVAYYKTRTLWFPFGLHLAWNWIQGAFLGITVSGLKELASAPLMRSIDVGPAWLTGGEYGIEGGIACTFALIAATLFIWVSPIFKATDEMLALTNNENPVTPK